MRHSIKHSLPPAQLKKAVQKFADAYCERFKEYQTTASWLADNQMQVVFKVKGIRLTGKLVLEPGTIGVDMDVPFAFQLFRGRAVKAIEDEVRPWLEKASRGELG